MKFKFSIKRGNKDQFDFESEKDLNNLKNENFEKIFENIKFENFESNDLEGLLDSNKNNNLSNNQPDDSYKNKKEKIKKFSVKNKVKTSNKEANIHPFKHEAAEMSFSSLSNKSPSQSSLIKNSEKNEDVSDKDDDKMDEVLNYDFLNDTDALISNASGKNVNNNKNNPTSNENINNKLSSNSNSITNSFLEDLEKIIKDHKCKGCGIELQCTKREKLGYIPDKKLKQFLGEEDQQAEKHSNNLSSPDIKSKAALEDLKLENIEIPKDLNYIKALNKKKLKKSDLICERCFKLQNYLRLGAIDSNQETQTEKNKGILNNEAKVKYDNYTMLIKKIDTQKLIQQILVRLSSKSQIFYLCVS